MDKKTALSHYLECERMLNTFFEEVNYCLPNCISQEKGKMYHEHVGFVRGDVGCCTFNYHASTHSIIGCLDVLIEERGDSIPTNTEEEIEGVGQPCDYHTSDGCLLTEYKGPLCLGAICDEQKNYIKGWFGIKYNSDYVIEQLERILNGTTSSENIIEFKKEILKNIEVVKRVKEYSTK